MKYKFARNVVLASLVVTGIGLWGNAASDLSATVNTVSGVSQTGSIPTSFTTTGFDNDTIIDTVSITDGNIYLSPLVETTLSFTVTDLDGFDGLQVEVRFFFDVDHYSNLDPVTKSINSYDETEYQGNATLDAAYDAHPSTGADGDAFVLVEKGSPTDSDYFDVAYTSGVTSSDVSWVLVSSGYAQGASAYERDFEVKFIPSKVAKYTWDGEWTVGIRIYDATDDLVAEYFETSLDMDWYGEIVLPDNITSLAFNAVSAGGTGTVEVGSEFINNTLLVENVLFIANGQFDQLIGSNNNWVSDKIDPSSGGMGYYYGYLTEDLADLSLSQYFAMVASDIAVTTNFESEVLVQSYNVDNNAYADTIVETHNGTVEAGVELDYYLYIKTSANFQNATYTGNLFFGIQNTDFNI